MGEDVVSPQSIVPTTVPVHDAVAVTTMLLDVAVVVTTERVGAAASQTPTGGAGAGDGAGEGAAGPGVGAGVPGTGAGDGPAGEDTLQKAGPPACSAPSNLYGACGGVSTSGPTYTSSCAKQPGRVAVSTAL